VFPRGSALKEIERRTKARLKKGDVADRVEASVVDGLAGELVRGHGLGIVLRPDGQAANDSFQVAAE
jgi:intracellular multiplication protein IcmB